VAEKNVIVRIKMLTQVIPLRFPGMGNGCEFQERIQNGYRMEKPEYSPNFLGEIMKICWTSEPKERPTFFQLEEMIKNYIESIFIIDYSN
jgi:hypothetical protein